MRTIRLLYTFADPAPHQNGVSSRKGVPHSVAAQCASTPRLDSSPTHPQVHKSMCFLPPTRIPNRTNITTQHAPSRPLVCTG